MQYKIMIKKTIPTLRVFTNFTLIPTVGAITSPLSTITVSTTTSATTTITASGSSPNLSGSPGYITALPLSLDTQLEAFQKTYNSEPSFSPLNPYFTAHNPFSASTTGVRPSSTSLSHYVPEGSDRPRSQEHARRHVNIMIRQAEVPANAPSLKFYDKNGKIVCPEDEPTADCRNSDQIDTLDVRVCANGDDWQSQKGCYSFKMKNKQCLTLPSNLAIHATFMRLPRMPFASGNPCWTYNSDQCQFEATYLIDGDNKPFKSVICDFDHPLPPYSPPPSPKARLLNKQARRQLIVSSAPVSPLISSKNQAGQVGQITRLPQFYDSTGQAVCPNSADQRCWQIGTFDTWFCTGSQLTDFQFRGVCEVHLLSNNQCFDLPSELEKKVTWMERPAWWMIGNTVPCTGYASHGCPDNKGVSIKNGAIDGSSIVSVKCFFDPRQVPPYYAPWGPEDETQSLPSSQWRESKQVR
jgi:hypothetical protein